MCAGEDITGMQYANTHQLPIEGLIVLAQRRILLDVGYVVVGPLLVAGMRSGLLGSILWR